MRGACRGRYLQLGLGDTSGGGGGVHVRGGERGGGEVAVLAADGVGGGGAGDEEPGGEGAGADDDGKPRAAPVAYLPGEDHREQAGGEEPGERPGVHRQSVQVADGARHRRRHRHGLERNERDGGNDPDGDPPVLGVEGLEASVGIVSLGDFDAREFGPQVVSAAAEVAGRLS